MIRIGILALQGSVAEHLHKIAQLPDVIPVPVKTRQDLRQVDGLILPGGESTTLARLLQDFNLFSPLKVRIEEGLPVWGTCAGMILLARTIDGESTHLGVMDITVRRNAYGRQNESFAVKEIIPAISSQPLELVFIRAPWIEETGRSVEILHRLDGHIVAARQANMLVTSFHPELTENLAVHRYFVRMSGV